MTQPEFEAFTQSQKWAKPGRREAAGDISLIKIKDGR
jgi:hypothetical protein